MRIAVRKRHHISEFGESRFVNGVKTPCGVVFYADPPAFKKQLKLRRDMEEKTALQSIKPPVLPKSSVVSDHGTPHIPYCTKIIGANLDQDEIINQPQKNSNVPSIVLAIVAIALGISAIIAFIISRSPHAFDASLLIIPLSVLALPLVIISARKLQKQADHYSLALILVVFAVAFTAPAILFSTFVIILMILIHQR